MKKPLSALAAAAMLAAPSEAQANRWETGEPLPRLRLPTIDGGMLTLSDLEGRKVLLIEFASW